MNKPLNLDEFKLKKTILPAPSSAGVSLPTNEPKPLDLNKYKINPTNQALVDLPRDPQTGLAILPPAETPKKTMGQRQTEIIDNLSTNLQENDRLVREGRISPLHGVINQAGAGAGAAAETVFNAPVLHEIASMVGAGVEGAEKASNFIWKKIFEAIPETAKKKMATNLRDNLEAMKLGDDQRDWDAINQTVNSSLGFINAALTAEGLADTASFVRAKTPFIKKQIVRAVRTTGDAVNDATVAGVSALENVRAGMAERAAVKAERAAVETQGKIKDTTNEILQGKSKDIPAGQRALTRLDPSKVKTYKQAADALDTRVQELTAQKDAALKTDTRAMKLNDIWTKVGGETVNYAKQALQQLRDYYTKTNNLKALSEVAEWEAKGAGDGLTVHDLELIARRHGAELNAYNANGELASGLNRQAAEATRQGLKNQAREIFGAENPKNAEAYRAADLELSDAIRTRDLMRKMEEAVLKAEAKIHAQPWYKQVGGVLGRKVAQALDLMSGNTLRGAFQYLNEGMKAPNSMNAIQLEEVLSSNLKRLQRLSEENLTGTQAANLLQEIIDEANGVTISAPKSANLPRSK